MRDQQTAKLAHSQAAAIEYLQDRLIAHALWSAGVHPVYDRPDFLHGQHGREIAAYLGRIHGVARVVLALALEHEPVEKRSQGAELARLRALRKAGRMRGEERRNVFRVHGRQ